MDRPYRRRLAVIERFLMADAPALSSKFAVFNELPNGERPAGAEPLSPPARLRPRSAYVVTLLVLAGIVALWATLSAQIRPSAHTCRVAAAAVATRSAGPADPTGSTGRAAGTAGVTGASGYASFHGVPCRAYPITRQ